MIQGDLFEAVVPTCGACPCLGAAIESGIRYCWGEMTFRWPSDRVEGCSYRGQAWRVALPRPEVDRTENLKDLLNHPRHNIDAKGRKWLEAELKAETRLRAKAKRNAA